MSEGPVKRIAVWRVKFYVSFHDTSHLEGRFGDDEIDQIDLSGETIERDVMAETFEEAVEKAKYTMNEGRMGKGLDWEVRSCELISIPE